MPLTFGTHEKYVIEDESVADNLLDLEKTLKELKDEDVLQWELEVLHKFSFIYTMKIVKTQRK